MVVSRKHARTPCRVICSTMTVDPKMFYVVLFATAVLDGWVCQVSGQATGGMGVTDYYNRGGHGIYEQLFWREELKEFLRSELQSIVEVMHEDVTVKIEAVRNQLDRSRNERQMEREERREAMALITNGIESVREQLSKMQNASQATVDEMRLIGKQLVRIHNKLNTYIDEEKVNRQKLNESFEVQKDIKLIGIQLLGIFNDSKLEQHTATSSLKAIEDKLTLFPIQIEQQIGNATVFCANSIGKQEPLLQTLIDFNFNISKSLPITNEQQVRIQDQLSRAQIDRQVMNSTILDMVESISNQILQADFDRQNLSRNLEQIQNKLAQAENDRQMVNQTIVNELKTIGDQLDQVQAHGAFQNLSHNLVRTGNQSQNINFCQLDQQMILMNSHLSSMQTFLQAIASATTRPSGQIRYPNGSRSEYSNSESVTWMINVGRGSYMWFSLLNTEAKYDFVRIYAMSGTQLLFEFHGTTLPAPVVINYDYVTVKFTSDGSGVGRGFVLNWGPTTPR